MLRGKRTVFKAWESLEVDGREQGTCLGMEVFSLCGEEKRS